jgi:indole-3-glycerol phosphate synthase
MPDRNLPSILADILADKTARLEAYKRALPQPELARRCRDLPPTRDFRAALQVGKNPPGAEDRRGASAGSGVSIIAEFKRRSPSRGVIRRDFDLAEIHAAYRRGGAAAYSVLTEEDHFAGSLADLKTLRKLAEVPVLRKDFFFDPYQVYESRAAGADALLLIVSTLADNQLKELIELSRALSMEALVEVHSAGELSRTLACGACIVGINNRDLHSFRVDLDISLELARAIPEDITAVSESGIHGPDDLRRLQAAGIRAFLVGEHLLRAADPAASILTLKGLL